MLKQEINLFKALPKKQGLMPSVIHIVIAWSLLLACLIAYAVNIAMLNSRLAKEYNSVVDEISSLAVKLETFKDRETGLVENRKLFAILEPGSVYSGKSFYDEFLALTKVDYDDVWFSEIQFSRDNDYVSLSGYATSADAVREYMTRLDALDGPLSNKLFLSGVKMTPIKVDDQKFTAYVFNLKNKNLNGRNRR